MVERPKKQWMSWGGIIIWLILFWPVGLFFLARRLSADKSAVLRHSSKILVASYILMGMGAIYVIMMITGDFDMVYAAVLFGGGGIWVHRVARKARITGDQYRRYIELVVNRGETSIDSISAQLGVPYETAVHHLRKMIDAGYFRNAYIAEDRREIVLGTRMPQRAASAWDAPARGMLPGTAMPVAAVPQFKVVSCPGCGANNTVVTGQVVECDYCGSPLQ